MNYSNKDETIMDHIWAYEMPIYEIMGDYSNSATIVTPAYLGVHVHRSLDTSFSIILINSSF